VPLDLSTQRVEAPDGVLKVGLGDVRAETTANFKLTFRDKPPKRLAHRSSTYLVALHELEFGLDLRAWRKVARADPLTDVRFDLPI
jgi:hypothetical protein